jgi:hypothetical protein
VAAIEAADTVIGLLPNGSLRQAIQISADEVAQRVTAKSVAAEEHEVDGQDNGADADTEFLCSGRGILEPHALVRIDREDDEKGDGGV